MYVLKAPWAQTPALEWGGHQGEVVILFAGARR